MSRLTDWLIIRGTDQSAQRTAVRWMWRLFFLSIIGVFALFFVLSFGKLPSVTELENPQNNEASEVIASDGSVLGRFYTENRVMVNERDLSPYLFDALVATEDERYLDHNGIDWRGLASAIVNQATGNSSRGGASTITQQLAKQLFTEGGRSENIFMAVVQKMREWIIAVRLERKYTKREIIAMYLNRYDFINGAQGIQAAAENYFGTTPKDLELHQAATLVGMLKNASLFNPLSRPERVLKRREVVLKQMVRNNLLTDAKYNELRQLPLGITYTRQSPDDGLSPYFRMVLAERIKRMLGEKQYLKADGSKYDIYRDGLRIYTTIDSRIQAHAEKAMLDHMTGLQDEFFKHWKNSDPWTYKSPTSETETEVDDRKRSLTRLIRRSDRYQRLRDAILNPAIERINQRNDLQFNTDDREVERLISESEEPGLVTRLIAAEMISPKLGAQYRQVIKMDEFTQLKSAWRELQQTVQKEFDQPVKMMIFSYEGENMREEVTMTPLDSVRHERMILQLGSMSVEPRTGFVRSWIGGVNFRDFKFDHVTARRQVGSTFKPFIYATSIELRGITPCFQVRDMAITIAPGDGQFGLTKSWTPRNSNNSYSGNLLTLIQGLRQSVNTVSAYLMQELESTEPVRNVVSAMGIDKEYIPPVPSIALGAVDLTVEQMTGAYTTFANNGIYNRPTYLLRIEDRNGQKIFEYLPEERQALSPQANYAMVFMLKNAAVSNLGGIRSPIGGKTGTTNDQTDGWYMGVTPNLVVGTWVGGEDRWVRFRNLGQGSGAHMAKPFFREFMLAVERDEELKWDTKTDFVRPPGDLGIELDCSKFLQDANSVLDADGDSIRVIDNTVEF